MKGGVFVNKVATLDQVIDKIQDGATIMIGGFFAVGTPIRSIEKLVEKGVKDLTVIAICNANPAGNFDFALLFQNHQIKKFITSHTGTTPVAIEQYKNGEVDIEYYPMGSFIEKVRAGGAGLGGVLTPTGIGTFAEEGKRKINIDGKDYLLELPLRAEYAFIKGYRADTMGNVEYRGVSINCNPILATAADYTVAEVDEIVEVGEIDPIRVGTPGIFVNAVVQGYSPQEHQDIYEKLWVRAGMLKA
jgi:acetate CoA/acetoacetate CoA-transferase alpha subunit